jgi:hypothetical protein
VVADDVVADADVVAAEEANRIEVRKPAVRERRARVALARLIAMIAMIGSRRMSLKRIWIPTKRSAPLIRTMTMTKETVTKC